MHGTPAHPPGISIRVLAFGGGLLFLASIVYGIVAYAFHFGDPAPSMSSTWWPLIFNVVLFTVFAGHHSVFARAGIKRHVNELVSPQLERSVYVWFASGLFIVVCALWRPVPGELWRIDAPWSYAFIAVQIAGIGVTRVASNQLDILQLAGIRQAFGGKTRAPVGLLESGLFRLVRHPIYFGWVLMVWPTPHMTGTRLAFAAISTAYLMAAIPLEERALRRDFGEEYDKYMGRVKWKMVPFVY